MSGRVTSLCAAMRDATHSLHARAERTGIVRELLAGRGTRHGYALLLRNLHLAYAMLEQGLESHRLDTGLDRLALPAVYREAALAGDLDGLSGPDWAQRLPVLAAGERYAARIAAAAAGDGAPLVAHAYVRYLGDLNGGSILRRVLGRALELDAAALRFYDFSPADAVALEAEYRTAIDAAGVALGDAARAVVDEAVEAFRLNIELSEAVAAAVTVS